MNKARFRLLVFFMSVSLIGLIVIKFYWINLLLQKNNEQFKQHVQQVIGNVSQKINDREFYTFYQSFNKMTDILGKPPKQSDIRNFYYISKNDKTNETVFYSNSIIPQDFDIKGTFFDSKADTSSIKSYIAERKIEVYNADGIDNSSIGLRNTPNVTIENKGNLDILDRAQFEIIFKDVIAQKSLYDRLSKDDLERILFNELNKYEVKTPFEFSVYNNGLATKLKSENFNYDKNNTYGVPIFQDLDGNSRYQLLVTFPQKNKYVLSSIFWVVALSLMLTLIIIMTYVSALKQLITQKQISEIKTDFINNMTHELKTPIATINLALDAIKNPKVIDDKEKVQRYLQMIKDENKRMHAQVENVLRISKLEKKELDIIKDPHDIHEIIEDAVEHIALIIEDREGEITTDFQATRITALLNDSHFTNVIVNILDNAIKYSVERPIINIHTENLRDFILIKIKDNGIGMSKSAQKRVFEKFFREHTGDVHNVKGHGLGLSYVKQIIDDHNGYISVESEKGKGSTFTIKLPIIN
ncbi:HAMP domain-containing sensor histidine kinase [Flavobacterium gelidilacus]|uniref:sensor histidine kinase n=1 Tax=Flavobacterium gelidilacus TaxID=206041 RepID=UPI00041D94C5|nr:HAMP domain-containing sensor histidine kinase [Flavobacterium gelidilacus]